MSDKIYDLLVIGGGINGAGIARDAAGRGLSVILVEAHDLGAATSSASSKLIHGGLRYLEYYDFRLVREALQERLRLLSIAPHIIWPLNFILPHQPHLRPAWMICAGLFLYDRLASRGGLPRSHGVDLKRHPLGKYLQASYRQGFSYADCWVDDARLVVLNAMDAALMHGAEICPRTRCIGLTPADSMWRARLRDETTGTERDITAFAAVNAAGPWVRSFLDDHGLNTPETPRIRLVKGSHIIVPRLHDGPDALILQQPDRRIVFVLPYEQHFSLVGTTEENFNGDPLSARISTAEIDYLCAAVNRTFRTPISAADVRHSFSGVRPLMDDGATNATAVTRDYRLVIDRHKGAPLLSVFGGKITTYRALAEQAINDLCGGVGWTGATALPGGDIHGIDFDQFVKQQQKKHEWLDLSIIRRYARLYGTRMNILVGAARKPDDLGTYFGEGVYEAELRYLVRYEWACTLEDILWRRTKLGLHLSPPTVQALTAALPEILKD